MFDKVQKRLEESKKDIQVTRKTKSPHTLLGITKCGLCGSSLTAQAAKSGKHQYYKCSKKIHATAEHCQAKDLPADVLENCIKDLIISMISDDEFFEAIYNQARFNNQEEVDRLDKDLKEFRSNKTHIESRRENLLTAVKAGTMLESIKSVEDELVKL